LDKGAGRGKKTIMDADQIHENSRIVTKASTSLSNLKTTSTTTSTVIAQSAETQVSKKAKIMVDLTGDVQTKIVEEVQEPYFIDLTTTEEATVVTADTEAANAHEEAESEPDLQMLWVIDTEPSAIVPEEEPEPHIQESYINLPPEPEFTGRPAKKAHRSKRGGKKLREDELERKRIKAMAETGDGHIALDEAESEEVDDDMLALEDYLQVGTITQWMLVKNWKHAKVLY
jgi:hypothetical protein